MEHQEKISVCLKIRRFSNSNITDVTEKLASFCIDTEYDELKKQIQDICEVKPEDNKVIKLRRSDEVLVPLSFLLEPVEPDCFFYLDVCKINFSNKPTASLLQDAYIDSVCQKLCHMESRLVQAEMLLPQLEWRRQAHMEESVSTLSNRVSFLNRRVDDLLPEQWKSKMPQTIA